MVTITIGGNPHDFILDTGGFTSISSRLKEEYGLKTVGQVTVSDINNMEIDVERVMIPNLQIGAGKIDNVQALSLPDRHEYPDTCFALVGMIGRDILKGKVLYLDYRTKLMRIYDQAEKRVSKRHSARLRTSKRGLPMVQVLVDGKKDWIEIDLGSRDVFSYQSDELEDQMKLQRDSQIKAYQGIFSYGVSGKALVGEQRFRKPIQRLEVGNSLIPLSLSDFSKKSAPRLGAGLLPYGTLVIDWQRNRFQIKRYQDAAPMPVRSPFGFGVSFQTDHYIIKWIEIGSRADQIGLKYGDIVLKINGLEVGALGTPCDLYLNGWEYEKAQEVEISVQQGQEVKDFVFKRS